MANNYTVIKINSTGYIPELNTNGPTGNIKVTTRLYNQLKASGYKMSIIPSFDTGSDWRDMYQPVLDIVPSAPVVQPNTLERHQAAQQRYGFFGSDDGVVIRKASPAPVVQSAPIRPSAQPQPVPVTPLTDMDAAAFAAQVESKIAEKNTTQLPVLGKVVKPKVENVIETTTAQNNVDENGNPIPGMPVPDDYLRSILGRTKGKHNDAVLDIKNSAHTPAGSNNLALDNLLTPAAEPVVPKPTTPPANFAQALMEDMAEHQPPPVKPATMEDVVPPKKQDNEELDFFKQDLLAMQKATVTENPIEDGNATEATSEPTAEEPEPQVESPKPTAEEKPEAKEMTLEDYIAEAAKLLKEENTEEPEAEVEEEEVQLPESIPEEPIGGTPIPDTEPAAEHEPVENEPFEEEPEETEECPSAPAYDEDEEIETPEPETEQPVTENTVAANPVDQTADTELAMLRDELEVFNTPNGAAPVQSSFFGVIEPPKGQVEDNPLEVDYNPLDSNYVNFHTMSRMEMYEFLKGLNVSVSKQMTRPELEEVMRAYNAGTLHIPDKYELMTYAELAKELRTTYEYPVNSGVSKATLEQTLRGLEDGSIKAPTAYDKRTNAEMEVFCRGSGVRYTMATLKDDCEKAYESAGRPEWKPAVYECAKTIYKRFIFNAGQDWDILTLADMYAALLVNGIKYGRNRPECLELLRGLSPSIVSHPVLEVEIKNTEEPAPESDKVSVFEMPEIIMPDNKL